jgi:FtsH-binding integral membrane protein
MDSLFGNSKISVKALSDFSNINKATKQHLKNVYVCLALTMLSAAAGAMAFFILNMQLAIVSVLGSIILIFALMATPHTPENVPKRLGFLCGIGGFTGFSLGPLLAAVANIDPSIIPTAFLASCAIFGSLSLAALLAERRSMLFLGGFLLSGLNMLVMMLFFNIFLGSYMVFQLDLYGGLLLFCGFVLFDTQLIVERYNNGDDDYIRHSLNLFLDFINIFRRLLIILASKEKKRKN